MRPIRDQGDCGSCYAFAAAGMLADRVCLASNGEYNGDLAPQDIVNCDFNDNGCDGGMMTSVIHYLMKSGVSSENCLSYQQTASTCNYECDDQSMNYEKFSCVKGSQKILTDPDDIRTELMTNGPMIVAMDVYTDFDNYMSGIYEVTPGADNEGGHAIKLVGWGTDASVGLYWICENSWTDQWGIHGYFYIK